MVEKETTGYSTRSNDGSAIASIAELEPNFFTSFLSNSSCSCTCGEEGRHGVRMDLPFDEDGPICLWPVEKGLTCYDGVSNHSLMGEALHVGNVLHFRLDRDSVHRFYDVTLSLYANGFSVSQASRHGKPFLISQAFTPFTLTHACRLHSDEADSSRPLMRLFKVVVGFSMGSQGTTFIFAIEGASANDARTRWVADFSRTLRSFTQSLFPPFRLAVQPVKGSPSTQTRLLAGYLLMDGRHGLCLAYGELHAHCNKKAAFIVYENEFCDKRVINLALTHGTRICDRVGVDCSCFMVKDVNFCTRTAQEKSFWLRALNNLKIKLQHCDGKPTDHELKVFRSAIAEGAKDVEDNVPTLLQEPLLPRIYQFDQFGEELSPALTDEDNCEIGKLSVVCYSPSSVQPAPQLKLGESPPSALADENKDAIERPLLHEAQQLNLQKTRLVGGPSLHPMRQPQLRKLMHEDQPPAPPQPSFSNVEKEEIPIAMNKPRAPIFETRAPIGMNKTRAPSFSNVEKEEAYRFQLAQPPESDILDPPPQPELPELMETTRHVDN